MIDILLIVLLGTTMFQADPAAAGDRPASRATG